MKFIKWYRISYPKHEIKSLSHNKRNREKELFGAGAGRRRFKLDVKDRGYHHHGLGILSYIYPTYILTGFMFDLGFLGVEKNFPKQKSSIPIKKEKGSQLTA